MPKAIEHEGHRVAVPLPLALRRYEANKLPDPGQCVDCLIIVNDRSDGQPRARFAVSNGASWDFYVREDQAVSSQAVALRPAEIDLTPMVRAAVEAALPALVSQPAVKVIQGPQMSPNDLQAVAQGMLEMSEHVNKVLNENADLRARIEFLESRAIVDARLVDVT